MKGKRQKQDVQLSRAWTGLSLCVVQYLAHWGCAAWLGSAAMQTLNKNNKEMENGEQEVLARDD